MNDFYLGFFKRFLSPTETNCQLEIKAIELEKQNNTCAKYDSCLSYIVREFWCTFVKCRFSNTNTQLKYKVKSILENSISLF